MRILELELELELEPPPKPDTVQPVSTGAMFTCSRNTRMRPGVPVHTAVLD